MKIPAEEYRELVRGLLADGRPVTFLATGLSMGGTIPDGAEVRVHPVQQVARGDVVLYEDADGNLTCHRLVRLWWQEKQRFMQTWGDTADRPDAPVPVNRVLGVVEGVKALGAVRLWWRGLRAWWRTK
ncbi:MAG: S24/S26 family peptidase [Armatimonadia bacterium]